MESLFRLFQLPLPFRIERAEENENKCWYVMMLVFSVVFYVGALIGIILLYVFFTEVQDISYVAVWGFHLSPPHHSLPPSLP